MTLDHIVLWVEDPLAALEFYENVVGLKAVNGDEFRAGDTALLTVRVGPDAVVDLMPRMGAAFIDSVFGGEGAAGNRVSHLCLAMTKPEYEALRERLVARKVAVSEPLKDTSGARGKAAEAFYFVDLDGNVLEARWYA